MHGTRSRGSVWLSLKLTSESANWIWSSKLEFSLKTKYIKGEVAHKHRPVALIHHISTCTAMGTLPSSVHAHVQVAQLQHHVSLKGVKRDTQLAQKDHEQKATALIYTGKLWVAKPTEQTASVLEQSLMLPADSTTIPVSFSENTSRKGDAESLVESLELNKGLRIC